MNVLIINGSPRANGNTSHALAEMKKIFDAENVETTILHIGNKNIRRGALRIRLSLAI